MMESTPAFVDGLGRRVVRRASREAAPTEHLLLDPALAAHAGFVAALRDRVSRVQGVRLSAYARALRVDEEPVGAIALVSEHVTGWRLADMLDVAESENLTLDIGVVMLLLRQLLPTAALLTRQSRDVASGALGPEHLLLTPQGRVVPTEYVFGPAIDALGWTPDRLWRTLRIATPVAGAGNTAVSHRGDVAQLGITVLSLVIGRRLRDDEFPERLEGLVAAARQRTPTVVDAPLSPGFRSWLMRALQLEVKNFGTLFDAQMALERLLATESSLIAQPAELDLAMVRLGRFMPEFELPDAPPEPVALPEVASSADDWAPKAPPVWLVTGAATSAAVLAPPAPVAVADVPAAMALAPAEPAPPPAAVPPTPSIDVPRPAMPVPAAVPPPTEDVELAPRLRERSVPLPLPTIAERPADRAPAWTPDPVPEPVPWWRSSAAVAALAVLTVAQAAVLGLQWGKPSANLGSDGELVVTSRPDGAQVVVDDQARGVTPLTVRIRPGTHVIQLRVGSAEPRVIPLTIRPGAQTAQYVEMQGVASTGVLEVRSEPAQARVTIDGQAKGSTPITIRDVAPGDYQVVLERGGWKSTQVVRVEPGVTAQLVVPIPRAPEPPRAVEPPPSTVPPSAAEPPKSR